MKKDIAASIEEIKSKKPVDPKAIGIPAYTPKATPKNSEKRAEKAKEFDMDYYIEQFGNAWGRATENIQNAADLFWQATCRFGEKDAEKVFSAHYPNLKHGDWTLLRDIGAQLVVADVFLLPWYMQGVRNMKITDQWAFFNTRCVSVYKFASEKPATIDIGKINQSDWRVAFDREKNRLRTSDEQIKYIRAKKKEFKERINWHVNGKGLVITNSCTITKSQLQDILAQM